MRSRRGPAATLIPALVLALGACAGPDPAQRYGAPDDQAHLLAPRESAAEPAQVSDGVDPAAQARVACMSRLPLNVRIGQTMLVTTTDIPRVQPWLEQGLIGGVMSTGLLSPALAEEARRATTSTRYGAILAADEEGGEVQRYRRVVGAIPSAARQRRTMTPEEVRDLYERHGRALAQWGVGLVMAPVADVGAGPGIGSRAYSDDARVVTEYAAAAAQGYAAAGLRPVLKHFPGHGSAGADSHRGLAVGPGLSRLRAVDLQPFADIPTRVDVAVMIGHTTVPGYATAPASQSRQVIEGLLIGELGFDGLIVSDALGMAAAGAPTQGDALVGFLRAGGDLGIVGPGGSVEGRRSVRQALDDGSLSEQRLNDAAFAVLDSKGVDPCIVAVGPVPVAVDAAPPSDPPVINPTEVP